MLVARHPRAHRPVAPLTTDRGALALVAIAVAGAAVSAYLTLVHYAGVALVCTQAAGIDCNAVTTSSYSLIPGTGVPISLAGIVWSAGAGSLGGLSLRAAAWPRRALLAWAVAGVLVVLYLVNAELTVIHAVCEWCTVLHVLIVSTFFLALARVR